MVFIMAGTPEYESFVYVFIFGIVIFFVGATFFGGSMSDSGSSSDGKWYSRFVSDYGEDSRLLFVTHSIELDSSADINSKFYSFGNFRIGAVSGENIMYDEETVLIQSGIFRKLSKEISFEKELKERVFIEFRIDEMNDYGNLMIDFNGERIYDKIGRIGDIYKIELNELDDVNEIKISAGSSGARFWAPSTYVIKDFKLTTLESNEMSKEVGFDITESQYKGFEKAVLRFQGDAEGNPSDISVKLNGHELYGNMPESGKVEVVDIDDKTIFSVGKNTVGFGSMQSVLFDMKNVDLEYYFYDGSELETKETIFYIDSKTMDKIENSTVKLSFNVDSTGSSSLIVKLNGKDVGIDTHKGDNSVDINWDAFVDGQNDLAFSSYSKWNLRAIRLMY